MYNLIKYSKQSNFITAFPSILWRSILINQFSIMTITELLTTVFGMLLYINRNTSKYNFYVLEILNIVNPKSRTTMANKD